MLVEDLQPNVTNSRNHPWLVLTLVIGCPPCIGQSQLMDEL